MDVRIGVTQSVKEIEVELASDVDPEGVRGTIEGVLSGGEPVLWLTDRRGRSVAVSAEKIAYVEIGPASSDRRIGFVG